ncbi:hypothetical protein CANARDRAFT_26576 [[Candida] arabinofermentans NRRL YB-2248]|uniref:Protein kinase domain-containing protein n=1 Tax=[Candida] arabinofermentans NRRL YB-2248 TaxID=983967 RepID=A0A1E4T5X0_9ASCO|nr:hypothetical protein CANARDRAFT_26576 [[Candida] arabinofermentans NRRL YB-2248]
MDKIRNSWVLTFQLRRQSLSTIKKHARQYSPNSLHHVRQKSYSYSQQNGTKSPPIAKKAFIGISTIALVGVFTVSQLNSTTLSNEAKLSRSLFKDASVLSNSNKLEPDMSQGTFEMGLYTSSQKELQEESIAIREKQTKRKFVGFLFQIRYFIVDYIFEPIVTVGRFLELATLFIPIVITIPLVYFGKKNNKGETSGAQLWYKLIRVTAEMAGASFIKLGQWAASRTDIFSRGLCDELSRLHSNAKSHSFRQTKMILERTFNGLTLDEIFDEFDSVPIGTGAIAQVYLGRLNAKFIEEGQDHDALVAVKVVHPNIEIRIERDLKIMKFFANMIDWVPTMEWLSLPQEVEQFAILMKMQLDLRIEGYNLLKFKEKFSDSNVIKFPKPFMSISSRKVLIEERVCGLSMDRILKLKENHGKNLSKEISDNLIDSFLKMLILDNFIHADLHPGNIFIRFAQKDSSSKNFITDEFETDKLMEKLSSIKSDEELVEEFESLHAQNYHPQVYLIDAGLVTELDSENRFNFISLFNALAEFDGYKAGELMIERSKTPGTAIHKELFKIKVEKLVSRIKERTFTLGSISIGDLLDKMLSMVRSHHVRMEGDFITVIVAILLLEGIGRQLDPELDLFARCVFAWEFGFPTF